MQQTGARQILNPNTLKGWELAEDSYAEIRANSSDIAEIAGNTGWSEARVSRIKDHVFSNEHQLDSGFRRFDADPDIVNSWNRLTKGTMLNLTSTCCGMKYLSQNLKVLLKQTIGLRMMQLFVVDVLGFQSKNYGLLHLN